MPNTRLIALAPALIACMLAAMPLAFAQQELATSYLEAQEFGRRDEADPQLLAYHRNVLLPAFGARYRAHLRDCQTTLPAPDQTAFSFVTAIGDDGRVLRVWSDRSTPVYSCLRGRLMFERLPVPPRAPFYLYIHVRYAAQ